MISTAVPVAPLQRPTEGHKCIVNITREFFEISSVCLTLVGLEVTESLCSIVASSDRVYSNGPSSLALSEETFTGSLDSWCDKLCFTL